MTTLTLQLESAYLELTILEKPFRLDAPRLEFSTSGATTPRTFGGHVEFAFHAKAGEEKSVGTVGQVFEDVASFLPPGRGTSQLSDKIEGLEEELLKVPIINTIATSFIGSELYVSDIVLVLDKAPGDNKYKGKFSLGLMCRLPAPGAGATQLRAHLNAFGAIVTMELEGSTSEFGFTWQ